MASIEQAISNVSKVTIFDFDQQLRKPRSFKADINSIMVYQNFWLIIENQPFKQVWIVDSNGFNALYEPYQPTTLTKLDETITVVDTVNKSIAALPSANTTKLRRTRSRKHPIVTEENIPIH